MKTTKLLSSKYRFFFLLALIVIISFKSIGQNNINIYSTVAKLDKYYDSIVAIRGIHNMQGTGYKDYCRWKNYWLPKTWPDGNLDAARDAINEYSSNFNNIKESVSSYEGNWQPLGPFLMPGGCPSDCSMTGVGRIHTLILNPGNSNQIYALSPSWGGIYRSNDYGTSWTQIPTDDDEIDGDGFAWLLPDHTNNQVLYLANGDGDGNALTGSGLSQSTGIFRTEDGGNSWTRIFNANAAQRHKFIRKLILDPNDSNRILFVSDYGIFKSTQPSQPNSFVNVQEGYFSDIEYLPGNNNTLFACGRFGTTLYKSTNDGDSWTKVIIPLLPDDTVGQMNIEFSTNPNLLYVLVEDSSFASCLYILNINSGSWQIRPLPYGEVGDLCKGFAVTPDGNTIYAGGNGNKTLWKSTNAGIGWSQMLPIDYHYDIHHLDLSPNNELWAATDGGIHRYNPITGQWLDHTNMSIANINGSYLSVAKSDTNYILMGCYDNGSNLLNKSQPGMNKWEQVDGGDGTCCVFDPADASTFYTSGLFQKIRRHDNYSQTHKDLNPPGYDTKMQNSLVIDAGNHNLIYMISDTAVFRSFDKGDHWQNISFSIQPDGVQKAFHRIFTSEVTPGVLYLQNYYYNPIDTSYTNNYWRTFNANTQDTADVVWQPFDNYNNSFLNDLVVNPVNPGIVYVVPSGYANPKKVLRFDENGWNDISYNLTAISVPVLSCLEYDRFHPAGRLYTGTIRGVFYLDYGSIEWKLLDGMPEADITSLEIQHLSGKLFCATYGKGVWETSLFDPDCQEPVVINKDTTQYGGLSLCDIHIEPGKTVTLKGMLAMGENSRIIVKRGAHLIIDGGIITGFLKKIWKGIEVWGDVSKTQSPASNQGWLTAKNGAIIENARVAVETIRIDGQPDYTYTGGIIQCTSIKFLNCTNGVVFHKYENKHPVTQQPIFNVSEFGNCTFEIDRQYPGTEYIQNMVFLSQVNGIKFSSCKFINNHNGIIADNATGIFSFNSGFWVYSRCTSNSVPCNSYDSTQFIGLKYGIRSLGAATTKTFSVKQSIFSNNTNSGIFASAINFAELLGNTFNVSKRDTVASPGNAFGGIYLDTCKFYVVEENVFNKTTGGSLFDKHVGLTINNSGTDNNEIYKNTFNNLDIGILAQGVNKHSLSGGLCLRCNIFNNCKYDIAVTAPANANYNLNGIAKNQGGRFDPVGNFFTPSIQNPDYHFWNLGVSNSQIPDITYYHHSNDEDFPRVRPDENRITNLFLESSAVNYDQNVSCPSKLNSGSLPSEKTVFDTKADSVKTLLEQLVDEGNTTGLANEISSSFPDDALQLHDELLDKSPFLSDTVLHLAIEKESVLNNALLRDVLCANPQTAKSDELMEAVDERWEQMPDDLKEEIMEGCLFLSEKEKMEADLANYLNKSAVAFNRIIGNQLHDSINEYAGDSALALLTQSGQLPYQYISAIFAHENNDTLLCREILDEIADTWYPDGNLPNELLSSTAYFQTLSDMALYQLPLTAIDSSQAGVLSNLMFDYSLTYAWVRNLLVSAAEMSFTEQYLLPEELKSADHFPIIKKKKPINNYLKTFPNPSKEYVIFEYGLNETESPENVLITLTDSRGITHQQLRLKRPTGQMVVVTRHFAPGMYICNLISNKKVLLQSKFSIIRLNFLNIWLYNLLLFNWNFRLFNNP